MNPNSQIRYIFPSSVIIANVLILGLAAIMPGNYLSQLPFYLHPGFILTSMSFVALSIWAILEWKKLEDKNQVLKYIPVPPYFKKSQLSAKTIFKLGTLKEKLDQKDDNQQAIIQDPDWLFLFV